MQLAGIGETTATALVSTVCITTSITRLHRPRLESGFTTEHRCLGPLLRNRPRMAIAYKTGEALVVELTGAAGLIARRPATEGSEVERHVSY